MKNRTGRPRYDIIAREPMISFIRLATLEESEGDSSFVIAELADGWEFEGRSMILADGVGDLRKLLDRAEMKETTE